MQQGLVKTEKLVELLLPVENPCKVGILQGNLSLTPHVVKILIMERMLISGYLPSKSIIVLEINSVLPAWSGFFNCIKILKFPGNEGGKEGYLIVLNFVLSLFYPPFYLDFKQDLASSPIKNLKSKFSELTSASFHSVRKSNTGVCANF